MDGIESGLERKRYVAACVVELQHSAPIRSPAPCQIDNIGSDAVLAGDVIIVAGEKMARQIACSLPIDDTNCGLSCDRAE